MTSDNSHNKRPVTKMVAGQPTSDGAGVRLTRLMGTGALPDLDPFLLLDEFHSDDRNDYIAGFPDHPHRGFETVTYMLAGRMRHGDNQGNTGLLRPGSVQWMTAGRGIVHSEMPEQEDGLIWGFQLWINLPAKDKMTAPKYQDIEPEDIPVTERPDGTRVKILAGEVDGIQGPVQAEATDPLFVDIGLPEGSVFEQPVEPGHAAFLYVIEGALRVGEEAEAVSRGRLAVLGEGDAVTARSDGGPARFILLAGRPLKEPVAKYGPFVMNSTQEIYQAIDDFRAGRF